MDIESKLPIFICKFPERSFYLDQDHNKILLIKRIDNDGLSGTNHISTCLYYYRTNDTNGYLGNQYLIAFKKIRKCLIRMRIDI
jgi:hypothetical protein